MFNRKNLPELPINVILTPFGRLCISGAFLHRRTNDKKVFDSLFILHLFILAIGTTLSFSTANGSVQLSKRCHWRVSSTDFTNCYKLNEFSVEALDLDETSDLIYEIEVENELVSGLIGAENSTKLLHDFSFATRQLTHPLLYDLPPPESGLKS